ncbi:hypothetical protein [Phaeodactylibacter xiamenensis]|jgi:hypothetical protein|uniref:hypothetical protein n=1 Tax=Phaeodactylibacter xiamenensis TaxID=1524460 RepID=UPI0024A9B6C0|nr:hypothetical protein [Phaeodactylibacter xiamenensis]
MLKGLAILTGVISALYHQAKAAVYLCSLLLSGNLPNQILAFLKKYSYYYGHIAGKTLDLNPD